MQPDVYELNYETQNVHNIGHLTTPKMKITKCFMKLFL